MKLKLDIKGMMCSACVSAVKNTVLKIKGVSFCDVSLITNNAFIEYDKDKITPDLIIKEIEKIGYGAEIHQNLNFKKEQEKRILENQKSKHKLISSIILLCALILIVISKMVFEKLNIYCFLTNIIINTSLQIAILLPIIVININYFISGFKSLLKLKPNMNSLVALGSTITTIYGITIFVISIATNNLEYLKNKIYFESSAMILTFVSIGKYIEHKATNKTNDVISKLVSMIPDFVTIKEKNNTKIISIDDLKINDKVIVKPGEIIPNDGIIIEGYGEINESTITGESIPEFKKINDEVTSGTLNENGFFIFKVTKLKEDNTLNKIIKLVEDASTSKIPIAKTVDKIAGIFVPFIIIISISVFLIWMLISQGNLDKSLNFAISTLVISCPCALGLATPLTIMIGAGKGAENGILIKSSEVIEKINKIDTIILDKTGTITKGEMKIQNFYGSQKYINEIISIEKLTNHPLGKAIVNYKKSKDIKIDKFEYLPGLGSVAFIKKNKFLIGNLKLIKKNKITINEEFNNKIEEFDKKGFTQVLVSRNNELINIICISDEIRNDSIESINSLKEFKKDIILLTGDSEKITKNIANKLGINNYICNVNPLNKLEEIVKLQNENKLVMMVGDGINDAPALKKADVGIAIGSGTDVAIESCDIVLINSNLADLVYIFKLSKKIINNIKGNLFWAFFYNVIMIPLAAGALSFININLNPMIASAAMSLSSITVVLNSLRLKFLTKEK